MTIAESTEAGVLARERQYQAAVDAAARGDADARDRLPELRRRLDDLRQHVESERASAADVARAQERERAAASRQVEAERLRIARDEYQAACVARDTIAIDDLEAALISVERVFRAAVEAGAQVDAAAAKCGLSGRLERIDTPAAMARQLHDMLMIRLNAILPNLGAIIATPGIIGLGIAPLSRPAPTSQTLVQPPDRFVPRQFELTSVSIDIAPVEHQEAASSVSIDPAPIGPGVVGGPRAVNR